MALIIDAALDALLEEIRGNVTVLHICKAEPADYAGVGTHTLGNKATPGVGAIGDRGAGGREFQVNEITDGSVTGTDTATHWALVDATRLLATHTLSSSQAVTSGNTFTLTAFKIGIPDPA